MVNTSRVVPARLRLVKPTGGAAEVLLLEPDPGGGPGAWQALVRPGRRLAPGTVLSARRLGRDAVEVGERLPDGRRRVRLLADRDDVLAASGSVALPPYIHEPLGDPDRYQTVYADRARLGGGPHRRTAPDQGRPRPLPGGRRRRVPRRPGRRPGHVSAHDPGPGRGPRHAHRALPGARRDHARLRAGRAG